jgi:hypothetical protein
MSASPPERSRTRFIGLTTFGVLLGVSLLLFAGTSWLEGVEGVLRHGPYLWIERLDTSSALSTLSNAAEVVAAVLAIAITVVAIVLELAANRYTHRITQLFFREPVNAAVMGFFVVTAVQCLWVSASLNEDAGLDAAIPYAGVVSSMAMVTASLLILLPYFAFVFSFLSPLNVVDHLRVQATRAIAKAVRRQSVSQRAEALEGVEELEDVALNAMEHKDRAISMASVDALAELLIDYGRMRDDLPAEWFAIDGPLAHDPDFISMAPALFDEISSKRTWFEMKVLRQYHALFTESLNRMRDVGNLIALNTRRIAIASPPDRNDIYDLALRFFNSYLRAAINAKDVRTAYYVCHQYRILAEQSLDAGDGDRAIQIARYFRYYGQLGFAAGSPFLLEAMAYDLALVVERSVEKDSPATDSLLGVFLEVDRESESPEQEMRVRGVRRAQVQLATFFLVRGDTARARSVFDDMAEEKPERLRSIREELLSEVEPLYWELTDRGVNFGYLPPDRRAKLSEFFGWFGDRLD